MEAVVKDFYDNLISVGDRVAFMVLIRRHMSYRKGVVESVSPTGYVNVRYELNGNERTIVRSGHEVIIPR